MRDQDIDSDLEIFFFGEYVTILDEFTDGDPLSSIKEQFENLVEKEYGNDDNSQLYLEHAKTFLNKPDIQTFVLSILLLRYAKLKYTTKHELKLAKDVPFLTFAIAQSKQFTQFKDQEVRNSFIDSAINFLSNIHGHSFGKYRESMTNISEKDPYVKLGLDGNIKLLEQIINAEAINKITDGKNNMKHHQLKAFTDILPILNEYRKHIHADNKPRTKRPKF